MAADRRQSKRRSRIVSPLALLIITGVLVVALILLFPARRFSELIHSAENEQAPSDSSSISYLRSLLSAHPDDRDLRYKLAQKQARAGQIGQARKTLDALPADSALKIQWLRMQLAWRAFNAATPGDPARQARRGELIAAIQHVQDSDQLSPEQLQVLAKRWLELGEPARAARVYQRLARRQPERAYHWYGRAARWWLAADRPDRSADAWGQASTHATTAGKRRQAAMNALEAARQMNDASAVKLAARFIRRYPNEPAFLDIGVDMALARNRLDTATRWSNRYLEQRPNDQNARIRATRIALAQHRLAQALDGLHRLVAEQPTNDKLRARLAQVQVWAGHSGPALANYRRLARTSPRDSYDQQIVALGQDLHDTRAVLSALERIQRRHPLSPQQRLLLVDTLNNEGRPERAIRELENWTGGGGAGRDQWVRMARLQALAGKQDAALRSWRKIESRYGRSVETTQARARLLADQWRLQDALDALHTLSDKPLPRTEEQAAYWHDMGDLAWNLNDPAGARRAYYQLYLARKLDAGEAGRLITAAAQTGHLDTAMRVARSAWRDNHDPAAILSMLDAAERAQRDDLTQKLLALAGQRQRVFARSPGYWQYYAGYHLEHERLEKARRGFLQALSIAPHDAGSRAGLLYTLAAANRDPELRGYINDWRADAKHDPRLWQAFAAAYTQLGEPRRALSWYHRALQADPDNYLLLLDYADALEGAKRFEQARDIRRRALSRLRPRLIRDMHNHGLLGRQRKQQNARILAVQTAMLGPDAAYDWVRQALDTGGQRPLDAIDTEMLLGYFLSRGMQPYARYWLLRAQRQRIATQPWQRLVVAMQHNDQVAAQAELAAYPRGGGIGIADRVDTLRQLDYRERALVLALDHTRPDEAYVAGVNEVPRYAAELYRDLPQNYGSQLRLERISDLDISAENVFLRLSGERLSARVELGARQLNDSGLDLRLDGLNNERYGQVELSWRERRGETTLRIGAVTTQADDLLQLGLRQDWQLRSNIDTALFARYNRLPEETGQLRALGVRDDYGGLFDWRLTARDSLALTARYSDFHSREAHNKLGDGYLLDVSFLHSLVLGPTHQIQVRGFASTEQNSVVDALPADVAGRLNSDVAPETVLPERFTFIGAGLSIARGTPGSEYPVVASPRYRFDLDTGYVMPGNQLGVSANFSIGTRVLGSDELSLAVGVDQTGGDTRQNSYNGRVQYRYFLGR